MRPNPQNFAMISSLIMIIIAITSFVSPGSAETLPDLKVYQSYGLFLDLLPMNILNKLALVLFAFSGAIASKSYRNSVLWCKFVFFVMAPLAVLGIIPETQTLFGIIPLFGGSVSLHAFFAFLGMYFGFSKIVVIEK